jgi:penicillin-binding protein 1A
MSLRDGLVYSKNTITAQLMQQVGPAGGKLAREMGVRQSKLEVVPSLALGTSPVTLKEMVRRLRHHRQRRRYLEPLLVTRIEDRTAGCWKNLPPQPDCCAKRDAPTRCSTPARRNRPRHRRGIRSRYGMRADVAGKTGTTQDNTDGWFILMHPQLVAGGWVGFNDNRITLRSDYWGQGAHSALPVVGEFFRNALRARLIDPHARFVAPEDTGLWARIKGWFRSLLSQEPVAEPKPQRIVKPARKQEPPQEPAAPAPVVSPTEPSGDPLQEKIDQIMKESDEGERLPTDPSPAATAVE